METSKVKNRIIQNIGLLLLFFAIPFLIYIGTVMNGNIIVSGDGMQFSSYKVYANQMMLKGILPYWCKYMQNGIPFLTDQSFGVLYPIGYLFAQLPIEYFVLFYYCFHIMVAGFFMYHYLKELGCSSPTALIFALIFSNSICLGGYRKDHVGIISTVVWIPSIFYFIQRYVNGKGMTNLLAASIFMALQFLAGFAQIALYSDIIAGLYLLFHMICRKMNIIDAVKDLIIWGISYIALILFQLLPMLSVMTYYSSVGAADTPYETFITYSISFRKLLMMIYPKIFGADVYMPYGYMYSSEMDIELFIGMTLVILCILALIFLWKKVTVKIIGGLSLLVFLYAANAHIPFLSQIIFRIPLLGSFRVPSRILFLFIFFMIVLAALMAEKFKNSDKKGSILKASVVIYIIFILLACISSIVINAGMFTPELKIFYDENDIFLTPILLAGISLLFMAIYAYCKKIKVFYIYLVSVLCITLFQTTPYYTLYSKTTGKEYDMEAKDELKAAVGSGNLWFPSETQNSYFQSKIGFNKSIILEIPTINCYIAMNNPALYRLMNNNEYAFLNYSGLYTWFPMGCTNLIAQNNIISMLGVTVISDSEGLVPDDGGSYFIGEQGRQIYSKESIDVLDMDGELFLYYDEIQLKDNTYYKISFDAVSNENDPSIYMDFYGNQYDSPAQNYKIRIEEGENSYTCYIFSGNLSADEQEYFRIVGTPDSNIQIKNLVITEMDTSYKPGVYTKIFEENGYSYYRNNLALDKMYFTEAVKNVSSENELFSGAVSYDFSKNSYVLGIEDRENLDIGEISEFTDEENSFKAKVTLENEGFLNFIQNYFLGWKVYIDGEEAELYVVNGLIQGVFVPAGEHIVEFSYVPQYFYIGSAVSLISFAAIIAVIVISHKREQKGSEGV